MSNLKLNIAFGEYDRTRPLADGTVKIEGVDASFHINRIVTEVFAGMVRDRAYDVSELGLSYFLRTMDFDDPPFLAIPIFPVRSFRHSAIYINVDSGIKSPADLAGKTLGGFPIYGPNAAGWPKASLPTTCLTHPKPIWVRCWRRARLMPLSPRTSRSALCK